MYVRIFFQIRFINSLDDLRQKCREILQKDARRTLLKMYFSGHQTLKIFHFNNFKIFNLNIYRTAWTHIIFVQFDVLLISLHSSDEWWRLYLDECRKTSSNNKLLMILSLPCIIKIYVVHNKQWVLLLLYYSKDHRNTWTN